MKVQFNRLGIVEWLFPKQSAVQAEVAGRWQRAYQRDPELAGDLLAFAKLLEIHPDPGPPPDPIQLAIDKGSADMARKLLALMGVTNSELATMMGTSYETR